MAIAPSGVDQHIQGSQHLDDAPAATGNSRAPPVKIYSGVVFFDAINKAQSVSDNQDLIGDTSYVQVTRGTHSPCRCHSFLDLCISAKMQSQCAERSSFCWSLDV